MESSKANLSTTRPLTPSKLQMPAAPRNVDLYRVECVVHPEPPSRSDDLFLRPMKGDMWVTAAIQLSIDGKVVPATDANGGLSLQRESWLALKALDITFSLVDLDGRPMPTLKNDRAQYSTSLGNIRIHQDPRRRQVAALEIVSDRIRNDAFTVAESDEHPNTYFVRGAANLLCCKEDRKVADFRVQAEVKINRDRAKKLLCPPCANDCVDVTETLCWLREFTATAELKDMLNLGLTPEYQELLSQAAFYSSPYGSAACVDVVTDIQGYLDPALVANRILTKYANKTWNECRPKVRTTFKDYVWNEGNAASAERIKRHHGYVLETLSAFIQDELVAVSEACDSCDDEDDSPDAERHRGQKKEAAFAGVAAYIETMRQAVRDALQWHRLTGDPPELDPSKQY